jgi:hypothetical protein
VTVKAWLEGHQFDLDHLAQLFPTGDIRVMRDGDRYYLTSPQIDNPPAGTKNYEVAQRLIAHVNGYGSLTHSNFRPVSLTKIYDDEAGITVVPAAAHLELRGALFAAVGVVADPSGKVEPAPPPPDQARFALAASNTDVAEVFEIMSHVPLKWLDLRKIHEIICRSIEPTTIVKLGWTTGNRDSTFTSSASNPAISGSDALHARPPKGNQPKRKMSISEGRQYVRELVTKWLDYLR